MRCAVAKPSDVNSALQEKNISFEVIDKVDNMLVDFVGRYLLAVWGRS